MFMKGSAGLLRKTIIGSVMAVIITCSILEIPVYADGNESSSCMLTGGSESSACILSDDRGGRTFIQSDDSEGGARALSDDRGGKAFMTAASSDHEAYILAASGSRSKKKAVYQLVVRNGYKCWLQALDAQGRVKWSINNKNTAKIMAKDNTECEIMPLKDGRVTVTAEAKNITIQYKLTVKSGKEFLNAWCRQWVEDNITEDMDFKEKLIMASAYVVSNNNSYGNTSEPEDVITTGVGNCVSGGKLVACLCREMGYDAKVRFAAKDDMSRYPAGIIFMEQHHNVEVTVDGRKYYIDGTPGGMICYLSTKKKTLYYGYSVKNKLYPSDALLDIPIEELLG